MTLFIVFGVLMLTVIVWCIAMSRSDPPEFKGRNREFKELLGKTARPSKRKP